MTFRAFNFPNATVLVLIHYQILQTLQEVNFVVCSRHLLLPSIAMSLAWFYHPYLQNCLTSLIKLHLLAHFQLQMLLIPVDQHPVPDELSVLWDVVEAHLRDDATDPENVIEIVGEEDPENVDEDPLIETE
ncbi:hypothetical protein TSAR_000928 [Trichomalopsis sarcophagae]|uniref:Uncharacterized protein n=1 Tax=Trichomalopsis sarcophagae TaxID=543379 RepID=A0A232ERE8_9HYME|nr:hypothetical protein TSAR_000928 [Trichomalopsis sarcophagae]